MAIDTLSPELAKYHEPARETRPLPLGYKEPKTGKMVSVFHPEILGTARNSQAPTNFEALVTVELPDKKTVQTSFGDYLLMNGILYSDYKDAFKPSLENGALIRELHQKVINKRLADAIAADKTEGSDWEGQEQTKKDVEGFLVHLINDTGYGEALESTPQSDNKDKIDFFVKINPADFELEGEPVYFGVQHTISEHIDKLNKKLEMASNRKSIYIPEHPEYGRVTNALVVEDRRNYFPRGGAFSHEFTLNRIRQQTNRNPKAYEAFMYDDRGKRNKTSSDEAKTEAVVRIYNLYQALLKGTRNYLEQENTPTVKADLEIKRKLLERVVLVMKEDNQYL